MSMPELFAIDISHTPAGVLSVTADSQSVRGVYFSAMGQIQNRFAGSHLKDGGYNPVLKAASTQLQEYFAETRRGFDLPLYLDDLTPFQRKVLLLTSQIPFGSVVSYGELAAQAGSPGAARAIGAAMAGNPIPIIIPCHRVIGSDRSLHGYAAPDGIITKAILLQLEGHSIVAQKLA